MSGLPPQQLFIHVLLPGCQGGSGGVVWRWLKHTHTHTHTVMYDPLASWALTEEEQLNDWHQQPRQGVTADADLQIHRQPNTRHTYRDTQTHRHRDTQTHRHTTLAKGPVSQHLSSGRIPGGVKGRAENLSYPGGAFEKNRDSERQRCRQGEWEFHLKKKNAWESKVATWCRRVDFCVYIPIPRIEK